MTTVHINNKVTAALRQYISSEFLLSDNTNGLKNDDLLFESGIIDSVGAMTLILYMEERFSIQILEEELFPENFATIEHISKFISKKQNQEIT